MALPVKFRATGDRRASKDAETGVSARTALGTGSPFLRSIPMRARHFIPLVLAASLPALPVFAQTDFQYQPYATPSNVGVALTAPYSHVADFNGDEIGRAHV